jgi:hypothetical protein
MTRQHNRLLINSLPKSGTHLLAKVAELCGYQEHFAGLSKELLAHPKKDSPPLFFNYREVKNTLALRKPKEDQSKSPPNDILVGSITPIVADTDSFNNWLAKIAPEQYILGHIAYSANLSASLNTHNYRHLFIIRDPRSVISSLLSFITHTVSMPKPHFLEADFKTLSQQEQLTLLLEGGYAPLAKVQITPFNEVYSNMLNWQHDPHCLVTRFEDLIGARGGGSVEQQQHAVRHIVTHLGKTFKGKIERDFESIYSQNVRTFRKGSIDSWKQTLDDSSVKRLDSYCQPLCDAAGYSYTGIMS